MTFVREDKILKGNKEIRCFGYAYSFEKNALLTRSVETVDD